MEPVKFTSKDSGRLLHDCLTWLFQKQPNSDKQIHSQVIGGVELSVRKAKEDVVTIVDSA